MTPRLVLPDDPPLRRTFGSDNPTKGAYRQRLRRAEQRGILPRRVYLSSQRFGYHAAELEIALGRLPRSHGDTLGEGAA